MKHKTEFENMNATQRSLHNLICILDDPCELTYEQSISNAIDEITYLTQQRDELLAAINQAVMDLQAIKLCLPSRDTGFAETAITRLVEAGGKT